MAQGRLISRSLGSSRKFHHAQSAVPKGLGEFTQLLFTLLLAHTDDFGRMAGDAFTVQHVVFPTSARSEGEFESALKGLTIVKLIERYVQNDNIFLQVNKFEDHQRNLHKRTASRIPEVPSSSQNVQDIQEVPRSSALTAQNSTEEQRQERTARAPAGPPDSRVKEFLEWFQAEYTTTRHGADYFVNWSKDATLVKRLLSATDLRRLKLCAQILLSDKCEDEFVQQSDRGIGILAVKFNWASDRLAEWEEKHGPFGQETPRVVP